jgi:Domain of unknown function (DUF4375)
VNSSGDHARETVEALRMIGAAHTASLVERALAVFPGGAPSPDRDARVAEVEALSDDQRARWDELDEAFYRYDDDLAVLLRAYLTAHTEDSR